MSKPFEISARLRSFRYALRGMVRLVQSQHNAWIHAAATITVCGAGWWFRVSAQDWRWLVLAIGLVWMAEALNTAVEFLADAAMPNPHPLVRDAKDVAAAGVLVAAVAAAVMGGLIFWPYLR